MTARRPAFVCPHCGSRSWHPMDAQERFCAAGCGFVDERRPSDFPQEFAQAGRRVQPVTLREAE